MIGPRKKISKRQKHTRQSMWQTRVIKKLIKVTNIVKCRNCWKNKLSHRVCKECGFYAGKQVITIKSKSKEKIIES